MVDLNNIVRSLSTSGAVSGFAAGLAGTAVAGSLSGKKGRKMASSALKVGALAAVGGLAYSAYQRYRADASTARSGQMARPDQLDNGVSSRHAQARLVDDPRSPDAGRWDQISSAAFAAVPADEGRGLLLVRAMISAAAADGHMDADEHARIIAETQRLDLSPDEKATLFDELRQPLRMDEIVARVGDPETAIEVYVAAAIAVDQDRLEGREYLRELAAALELPAELVRSLDVQTETVRRDRAA